MSRGRRLGTQEPTWAVRSISLRARDGPGRLDQVYRRLLVDGLAPDAPLPADGSQPPLRRSPRGVAHHGQGR
jgi:hypothetical protein